LEYADTKGFRDIGRRRAWQARLYLAVGPPNVGFESAPYRTMRDLAGHWKNH
jgi:hypothetical protein